MACGKEEVPIEDMDIGVSCTLDMFREYKEVTQMILNIPEISNNEVLTEKSYESFEAILRQYQEQPHLLDPHLQSLLDELIKIAVKLEENEASASIAFHYMWKIVKVRGYKNVMKRMPHEVKDLLPVLNLLEKEKLKDDFHGNYILLMWLAIIIYLPFNMAIFDSSTDVSPAQSHTVIERILQMIKSHLLQVQSSWEMAAYLASKFVTRPDLKDKYMSNFINYCFEILEAHDPKNTSFHKLGVLRALGLIFKHGKREEVLDFSSSVLERLLSSKVKSIIDDPLRIYYVKLIQRIGLTFLRPKIALWRYQRGNRSLASNIENSSQEKSNSTYSSPTECETDCDYDIPAEIEDVIDSLLKSLKDEQTVVRWSSAKGIGRITERLPHSFADEVIEEVLQLFTCRESDKAWHGGCLALAELARRGLLLPERLTDVMPILERALVYDKLRGQFSVGANIRDAACYLCWSFARAYHPDQMRPYVHKLATGLLIVALFDREIPCRRAASAAFQEHVGRQGNFPHGIEILTTIDYFTVGNRTNAYLSLSVMAGSYPDYTNAFIDHLVDEKVGHWDASIRELTAKALHNLASLSPGYMGRTILPNLLSVATGTVLIARHGAILASGYIIHALHLKAEHEGVDQNLYIENSTLEAVSTLIPYLAEKKLFKGMGGEYMRQAVAIFIEKCSLSKLPLEEKVELLGTWHDLLEDGILNFEDNIRSVSLNAIHELWKQYYEIDSNEHFKWKDEIVSRCIKGLASKGENHCLGCAALLGRMPKKFIEGHLVEILENLCFTMQVTPTKESWALTRKEAINSVLNIVSTMGIASGNDDAKHITSANLMKIFQSFLSTMDDYSTDRRGDIGSWVREAAMQALQSLVIKVAAKESSVLTPELMCEIVVRTCQQAVERIDRTRKVAGMTFEVLLYAQPPLPNIPNVEELQSIFSRDWCLNCNWASEKSNYPKFILLLDFDSFRYRMLLGLTYALGGMSAHLSRYSLDALQSYLNERLEVSRRYLLLKFIQALVEIFRSYAKDPRITLPLIKSISLILGSCNALDEILEENEDLLSDMLGCLKKECFQCNDFNILSATISTLCELLRIKSSCTKNILSHLTIFLGYQFPKVRAVAATNFLTALMDYEDHSIISEDVAGDVISILEDTPWMDSMGEAREQRNKICELLDLPVPQSRKKK